jgi:hypothetical protein
MSLGVASDDHASFSQHIGCRHLHRPDRSMGNFNACSGIGRVLKSCCGKMDLIAGVQ